MTKVKICGITNLEDALLSAKFGADALGFNFYEKSARYISPEKARAIIEQLPGNVLKVGVFVNAHLEKILETAKSAKLDAVQLHGEETPEFLARLREKFSGEIIKAFRVSEVFKPEDVLQFQADAVLLDAYSPKEHGGTGETFNWEIAKKVSEIFPKMYLAGGLSTENVVRAVKNINPFAIDACSRIESFKGKKDKVSVINFIKLAHDTDWWKEIQGDEKFKFENIEQLMKLNNIFPALYSGEKSLTSLSSFLSGVSFSCGIHHNNCNHSFRFSENFSFLLQSKYGSLPTRKIIEECNGDEERAFEVFIAFIEECKVNQKVSINE
ncbi:MAG: phosphoribosylanthranilate isomerase [Acidobacteria bacterium]|nr:phosphoribosylanthranilate isomerase [Acidobacteriota bacterium]